MRIRCTLAVPAAWSFVVVLARAISAISPQESVACNLFDNAAKYSGRALDSAQGKPIRWLETFTSEQIARSVFVFCKRALRATAVWLGFSDGA